MDAQLIGPDSRVWQECVNETPHDFYHMPAYVRLCARQERGEPLAFVVQEGKNWVLVPFLLRPIDIGLTTKHRLYDATSPYGYPSPLLRCSGSEETQRAFLDKAVRLLLANLRERGTVSAFLRLHPLLGLPLETLRQHGTLVHQGETVFMDLTQTDEELWRQIRSSTRNHIRRAARNGYVAEIDDQWDHLDEFFDIYTQTMRRVHAADYYFFPMQYFHDLKEALRGALHLCVVRINGSIACAGLFSEVCGIVQYHLSGMRSAFRKDQPTKLMLDFVRRWSKDRGNRVFHLGGGVGCRQDSVFYFKAGFSKQRGDFYSWRVVLDTHAYRALTRQRQQCGGGGTDDADDFFPAYRKPLPDVREPVEAAVRACEA